MNYGYINNEKVSKIVLGTDYYGSIVDEKICYRLYDMFTDAGGNHIDTAHLYVGGESERMLGRWMKTHGRDKIYIATKGAHPPLDNMNASRLTKPELKKDLEESLKRLGVDYIDLYWLHRDHPTADVGEVIDILNDFIKEGKIRAIGCSNWKGERIAKANAYAASHGLSGFSASQIKWSLAETNSAYIDDPTLVEMDNTEYEYYKNSGIPVVAFASQGKGFFSKYAENGENALSEKAKERYLTEKNIAVCGRVKEIAAAHNTSVGAVAVAYLMSVKEVSAMPIIGCKNEIQLSDSLKAADLNLTEEEMKFIYGE